MAPDLRRLPSVDRVLRQLGTTDLPRPVVLTVVRRVLAELRERPQADLSADDAVAQIRQAVDALRRSRIRPVINATGVILHTNLGRAPLSESAARAVADVARHYNTLEYDHATGERGRRAAYLEHNLAVLCAADAATVVNNCAAALVLILRTFAARPPRTHVVISRGELVQIGGGFRVPEILEASGATLREVGTTNQTSLDDYRRAIDDRTALVLRVHRSNFYLGGFVDSPRTSELAVVAREAGVPLVEDLGSGATFDTRSLGNGVEQEPTPAAVLADGADLVCFSGDKLLGGPQAGIVAGRSTLVARLRREPFFRALRCDKMVLAAMEATVDTLLDGRPGDLPIRRMMDADLATLHHRAEAVVAAVETNRLRIGTGVSRVGGGTLPQTSIESVTLNLEGEPQAVAARFRQNDPPIVGYIDGGVFKLDLRTVSADQDAALIDALRRLA